MTPDIYNRSDAMLEAKNTDPRPQCRWGFTINGEVQARVAAVMADAPELRDALRSLTADLAEARAALARQSAALDQIAKGESREVVDGEEYIIPMSGHEACRIATLAAATFQPSSIWTAIVGDDDPHLRGAAQGRRDGASGAGTAVADNRAVAMTDRGLREARRDVSASLEIAATIRRARIQRGWTQDGLARRMGTSQQNVQRLERPGYRPSVRTLEQVAAALEMPLRITIGARDA